MLFSRINSFRAIENSEYTIFMDDDDYLLVRDLPEFTDYNYYDSSTDPQKYWEVCFQEEYETLDWLYEHIEDQFTYEEISEDVRDGGLKLLDDSEDIDVIVSYCLENDIL
jgi:hypothetical protein